MRLQSLARALNPSLYDAIQPYRVTRDEQMPWAYQRANPNGRPYHDDWAIFKNATRMECAYRVPQPFKITTGPSHQEWMLFSDDYPMSPDTKMERRNLVLRHGTFNLPYVLSDRGDYGLDMYSAFINGKWRPTFRKYTGKWFGRRLSWYGGLHQDQHVSYPDENGVTRSDLMCWWPELALSWIKEA